MGLVFIIFICFFFIMVDIKVDEIYLISWFVALRVEDEGGVARVTLDWDELFKALEDMFKRNKLQVTVMGGVLWKPEDAESSHYLLQIQAKDPEDLLKIHHKLMVDLQFGHTRKIITYTDEQGPSIFKYYIAHRHAGCVVVRESKEGEKKMPAGLEVNPMKAMEPAVMQTDLQWMEEWLVQFFQEKLAQLSQPLSQAASEAGSSK